MTADTRARAMGDLRAWIVTQGLDATEFGAFLEMLCHRLVGAGLPLLRVNVSMRAQHPEVGGFAHRWNRQSGMIREEYLRDTSVIVGWDQSPLKALVENPEMELRHRIDPKGRPFRFPMFEDLLEMGATDYFAQKLYFSNPDGPIQAGHHGNMGLLVSWVADAPGGFSDRDLDDLRGLLPTLGLAFKSGSNYMTARDLLGVYLGTDAATRVMSGDILRGSVETIRTAILYFDLQGFTRLSETLPPETLIALLNDYFGEVVRIVDDHRGQVLKFMGDGLLAIFPEIGEGQSRLAAIDAVTAIRDEMSRINTRRHGEGLPVAGFSAAIHAGEVLYGNIGGASRLDFTVIGPAVNAASRILGMCSALDQSILISGLVARPALEDRPALVSLGQYRLRGVADRVELFTLD